jgi:hypothetical protein
LQDCKAADSVKARAGCGGGLTARRAKLLSPNFNAMNEAFAKLEAAIKARIEDRERAGWSRNIGAGFVEEDIEAVFPSGDCAFTLRYGGHTQRFAVADLNLRELDAVRNWVFQRIAV